MKKLHFKFILLLLFVSAILFMINNIMHNNNEGEDAIVTDNIEDATICMEMALFHNSVGSSYYFVLKSDGTLEVSFGGRVDDFIKAGSDFLETVSKKEETKISESDLSEFINMADEVASSGDYEDLGYSFGGMDIVLLYKGKLYRSMYKLSENTMLNDLIDKAIEYSPFEVEIDLSY